MPKLLLLLLLLFAAPVAAADSAAPENPKSDDSKAEQAKKDAPKEQADKSQAQQNPEKPGHYACQYYTVDLPENWQAILPPTENLGQVSAVFAKSGQNPSVTMTIAEHGGMPLETIAKMFAEQFNAPKPPTLRNGQYVFSYTKNDVPNQVWIATEGPLFMVTAIGGNQKEGLNFIKDYVKSEKYSNLFPR